MRTGCAACSARFSSRASASARSSARGSSWRRAQPRTTWPDPSLMLSYVVAGVTCIFAALCYAEFASMVPVAGSAYTYAYATLGELFAWIIGWDLILEYAVGAATVANGWSGYFQSVMAKFGLQLPAGARRSAHRVRTAGHFVQHAGRRQSAGDHHRGDRDGRARERDSGKRELQRDDGVSEARGRAVRDPRRRVLHQSGELASVRAVRHARASASSATTSRARSTREASRSACSPGAAIIFFAYIGFDSVSTHAEEAKQPRRDVPIGIIASLVICTVLYIAVVAVLTGMVQYDKLSVDAGVSDAFKQAGLAVGGVHHRRSRRRRASRPSCWC